MGKSSSAAPAKGTTTEGSSYHRAPPPRPETSCLAHLLPGLLLGAAAAGAWFAPQEKVAELLHTKRDHAVLEAVFSMRFGLAASLAVLAGVFLAQGVVALFLGFRRGSRAQFRPATSWTREWPWDPEGADDVRAGKLRRRIAGIFVALAAMAPFAWAFVDAGVLELRDLKSPLLAILLAPAAIELVLALGAFLALKFRTRGRLMYHHFPFALGSTFEARYCPPPRILRMGPRMKATLRCLEVTGRSGGHITVREAWRWTEDAEAMGDAVEIMIETGAPQNLSTSMPKRFWELEVGPWAPGAAGNATFVVPVYADPTFRPRDPTPVPQGARASEASRGAAEQLKPQAKRGPSDAPKRPPSEAPRQRMSHPPPIDTPMSSRLPDYPPVPVPRMEDPGALPNTTPTPFGITVETIRSAERFRCELALSPAISTDDLRDRVARAFAVTLKPLPGAEEGSYFGRGEGIEVALQMTDEGRRLLLGGPRPVEAGAGEANEMAAEWAIAKLLEAGVAARRPQPD